jgi:hypothetical protein
VASIDMVDVSERMQAKLHGAAREPVDAKKCVHAVKKW